MRPERLEFCGINSFSQKAVIDFHRLLSGGIFGIFGDTGSGKTTILDSMIFALYGRVDRIRGGTGCEIIHYRCDKAYVVFDFSTEADGTRKTFRVEREIKRKNSQQKLALYELDGERLLCISDGVKNTNTKIQEIVGLSFEDFKKCIALPQGEFAQFVKSDRGERLRLISRLFDLDMYGERLTAVLKRRYDEAKSALDKKEGELNGYREYTEEEANRLREDEGALCSRKKELDEAFALQQERFESIKNQYERGKKIARLQAELQALELQQEEVLEKKQALQRFPIVTQIDSLLQKLTQSEQGLRKTSAERAECLQAMESAEKKLASVQKETEIADSEGALLAVRTRLETFKLIAVDLQERKKLQDARQKTAREYRELLAERKAQEEALSATTERIRSLEEQMQKLDGDFPLESFLRGNFESALLRAEYQEAEQYFQDKLSRLPVEYPEKTRLYMAVESAITERLQHYGGLLAAQRDSDIEHLVSTYRAMQEQRAKIFEQKHALELEQNHRQGLLRESDARLQILLEQGQDLKNKLAALTEKCAAALGEDFSGDLQDAEKRLRDQEESILRFKRMHEQTIADLSEKINAGRVWLSRAEEREKSLRQVYGETQAELNGKLKEGGLSSIEQVEAFSVRFPDAQKLLQEIELFESKRNDIESSIRILQENGETEIISDEVFAAASETYAQLGMQKEKTGRELAILQGKIEIYCARLAQKQELKKERDFLMNDFSNVEKLRALLYGNRFMEFIAGEYLSEISDAATQTLLKLTNGRYFIRYNQGFFVGDNFNGGELRGVNTLSGGETFLISLSLALSLSAAIYAKSLKPIEFFFLDEGFGTLDEKLIDTVMDSLEKLKNTHFMIGLISHVEELKHRVENKIVVTGASENGSSSIKICC